MNRRRFVGAALIAGASAPRVLFASHEPDIAFPTEPRARLGVASYPFRAFIESGHNRDRDKNKPGMDLKDFRPWCARNTTCAISSRSTALPFARTAYLHGLREAIEKAGCHVINIPSA